MTFKTTFLLIATYLMVNTNDAYSQDPFITKWETTSNNESITIPTHPDYDYLYGIDWGDTKSDNNVEGDMSHNYDTAGVYIVTISPSEPSAFPAIYFNYSGDTNKIKSIEQWGDIEWQTMENSFLGCQYLKLNATDNPDLSQVESLAGMFCICKEFEGHESMESWETDNIIDMSYTFAATDNFNIDIGNWNTSNVTNLEGIFNETGSFNQDISYKPGSGAWNTSNVENLSYAFAEADNFNQAIGNWNTSKVTNMEGTFYEALAFNKDLGSWNTSQVINMNSMFSYATIFNQDIGNWHTHNVTDMGGMFDNATNFNSDIGNWNTSKVTSMLAMFEDASNFNQDISYKSNTGAWDVSMVETMNSMFHNATNYNQDIGNWDISALTDMTVMFKNAKEFDQDLSNWNFSSNQTLWRMLQNSGLSINNYDRLLQSFVEHNIININLGDATGLTYCNVTAHDKLTNEFGWTITGDNIGGPASSTWSHLNANWYDNESHWSDMVFPTLCTDVLIPDTKNISIQVGQKAMAATLEVELGATLDIPLGAKILIDPQF